MAILQNIATPRIYLNIPAYLASTGTNIDPVFRTLPVIASPVPPIPDISAVTLTNPYIAILGHSATTITLTGASATDIINGTISSTKPGFSIMNTDAMPTEILFNSGNAGSVLLGTFYNFFHSPDMKLSLSYDYSGIKETTTKGGNTITNAFYNKPSDWGNLGAWELGGTPAHAKSGRRIWSLTFSFLSDSSIFPTTASLTNDDDGSTTSNTLLDEDTLQRCIHLTNGGQIPFIFCSDGDNPRQDNLAIAKFDMKKFSYTQTSFNSYQIKLRIKEVW